MAREIINVGTNANDSTGDPLRTAFQKLNNMTAELYTDDASDVNSIVATAPIARNNATGIVTISLNDAGIVTDKIADDAVTTDKLANAINSAITANTAKVTNATHTGDVTGSGALTIAADAVITTKILNANVTTAKIADDAVTADKLANSINSEIAANTAKTGITSGQASAITANTSKVTNATHTGEVTGSGALTIASDVVDADNLKVTGNGSNGQALLSDGDGTFSWGSAGNSYTAGDGITLNSLEFDLDAALTTVTSIHNTGLKIGRGASDDYISFATDNQISTFIGNAEKMRLDSSFNLQVAGDVIAASTAFSDERLKENIKPIESPLESIKKLNGVTYDWKANGSPSIGVIAQNIQEVYPQLVKEVQPIEGDEKRLTVNYDGLIGVLIETVKELSAKIDKLENK